jgi:hypothetical protein
MMTLVRVVRRALLVALGSVVSAACSLLTSTDGLHEDGVLADGGPSGPDASEAVEASTSDAGTEAGTWCTTHQGDASFCEDFDTQGLARWEAKIELGGGTAKADTAASSSAPASMLSELPAVDGGLSEAFVLRKMKAPSVDVWAEAEFRLEQTDPAGSQLQVLKLLELSPTAPTDEDGWEVGVAVGGANRKVVVFQYNYYTNGYAEVFASPTPVALGAWTRVNLHLRLRNPLDGVVDLNVDGVRVATGLAVQPPFAGAPFQLLVGAVYTSAPHTGWVLRTDNVLFDAK